MFAVAIALVLGAVFYGLNNSSINQAGTRRRPEQPTQTSPRRQTAQTSPPAPPGMRDVTPRANTGPGVTTGAAPATPKIPPARPDWPGRQPLRPAGRQPPSHQITAKVEVTMARSGTTMPAASALSAEHLVQFAAGITLAELVEVPCSAISCAARMKPAQAVRASEPPTLIRRTPRSAASATKAGSADQKIDRFRMHGLHDRRYLLLGLDARRIQAIGAGLRVGLKSVDHQARSGCPTRKPSQRPVSKTPLLSASIAARAALMRSIAKARS